MLLDSCGGVAESDRDGDGLDDCVETLVFGTNPFLWDTDGDSFSDGREARDYDPATSRTRFNPLVADLARISVELTSLPQIERDYIETNGSSRTIATGHSQSDSSSISRSWGGESSRQLEVGHMVSVSTTDTVGVEVSVSPTDLSGSASYEKSLILGFESARRKR